MRGALGLLAIGLAIGLALGGCQGSGKTPVSSAEAGSSTVTGPSLPMSAPATTAAPTPTVGACPYLDTTAVQDIIGQHLTGSTYTVTAPDLLPGCTFSRPDGGVGLDVMVARYADPVAAQNAALALGTAAANPVTNLGEYAVVLVSANQTLLAVTRGTVLLSVTINQESSLEAHEIAALVVPQLG